MVNVVTWGALATAVVRYLGAAERIIAAMESDPGAPEGVLRLKPGALAELYQVVPEGSSAVIIVDPRQITPGFQLLLDELQGAQRELPVDQQPVKIVIVELGSLSLLLQSYAAVGEALGVGRKARDFVGKVRAQLNDWNVNFHERSRGKKVAVVTSCDAAGALAVSIPWLDEIIRTLGGVVVADIGKIEELVKANPDVLIFAVPGKAAAEAAKSIYPLITEGATYQSISAVKRGEVVYVDGALASDPIPEHLVEHIGVVISSICGLEGGFITARGSLLRQRWVELHRHRL